MIACLIDSGKDLAGHTTNCSAYLQEREWDLRDSEGLPFHALLYIILCHANP